MIISKLTGGLGNQLFQYAVGRQLASSGGSELKFDLSFYDEQDEWRYELHHLGIHIPRATPDECRELQFRKAPLITELKWFLLGRQRYPVVPAKSYCLEAKANLFDPRVLSLRGDRYLHGYWQSEKYFIASSQAIVHDVRLSAGASPAYLDLSRQINDSTAVSIHVRRGDYLEPRFRDVYSSCTARYYEESLEYISKRVVAPRYFVFSNDIPWCRDNLPVPPSSVFVGEGGRLASHEDLMLMSLCRHSIIANSTFSWWGAWLNRNPEKIVCTPSQWYCNGRQTYDLLPEQWVRIDP